MEKVFLENVEQFFVKIKDHKTELGTLLTYSFDVIKFWQSIF